MQKQMFCCSGSQKTATTHAKTQYILLCIAPGRKKQITNTPKHMFRRSGSQKRLARLAWLAWLAWPAQRLARGLLNMPGLFVLLGLLWLALASVISNPGEARIPMEKSSFRTFSKHSCCVVLVRWKNTFSKPNSQSNHTPAV